VEPVVMVLLPIAVHVDPSAEEYPLSVLPLRTTRIHCGAPAVVPITKVLAPPAVLRDWKTVPFRDVTVAIAYAALAVRSPRIMTAAFVQASLFSTVATRATISPSPSS